MDTSGLAFPKPEPRVFKKKAKKLDLQSQERICREAVRKRDKGRCVVPGCKEKAQHMHHIVYRSRGGKWKPENICSLCAAHHGLVHAGRIQIYRNADAELIVVGSRKDLSFKL